MAPDDAERKAERPREGGPAAPESAFQEANAGRQDLIREQRAQTEYLRSGGRSGITSEFGRMVITGLNAAGDGRRREGSSEEPPDEAAAPPERPDAGQARSGGFGRMLMDGLQDISRGLAIGEQLGWSARAEVGGEDPTGRSGPAEPGTDTGARPADVEAVAPSGRGQERAGVAAIERTDESRVPDSADRTVEVRERTESCFVELGEPALPSREALAQSIDVLMRTLRQAVETPAAGPRDLPGTEPRQAETSVRPEVRERTPEEPLTGSAHLEVEIGEAVIEEPPSPSDRIEVEFGEPIFETTERWGSREFTVLSDGTAEYTVRRDDTVWSIAREALEHRHPDYDPSGREILQEVRRIARDSGLEDPNILHPGDRIVIRPETAERAAEAPVRETAEAPVRETAESELSPEILAGGSPELGAMAAQLIEGMPAESLGPVVQQLLSTVPATSLAPLAAQMIDQLPPEALQPVAAELLRHMSAEFLPSIAGPLAGLMPTDLLAPMASEVIARMPAETLEPLVEQMIQHMPPERLAPLAARMVGEMPASSLAPVVEQMLERMPRGTAAPLAERLVRQTATDAPVERGSAERREDAGTPRMDPADFERAAAILSTGTDAPPPAERPAVDTSGVDRDRMLELARQIRTATRRDDLIDTGTDDDAILRAIEGRSEAERVVLAEIYQREYGISLHEEVTSEMSDGLSAGSLGRARVALEGREEDLHAEGVDAEALQSVVDEIWSAPITDPTGSGAEGIATLLESRTEAERRAIDTLFLRTHGMSLEEYIASPVPVPGQFLPFSDAERDHLRNLLHREDGSADFAGRIHSSLIELGQTVRGRDSDTVEQGLRTTLAVMNSEDIAALDREYRERYHVSLRDALMEDEHLSARTREVLDIYLRGSDERTDADTERLATIALENQDMTMFEEAFRSASPAARSAFMEAGGEARIRAAFGMHIDDIDTMSPTDFLTGHGSRWDQQVAHALDYARYGHLSLASSIRNQTSVIGDNETAIETAIGRLSDAEREQYRRGRELVRSGADEASLSAEDRAAVACYRDGHAALEGAGNETEVARWEDMIAVEGGSMVSRLAAHAGTVYDDSMDDVLSDIEGTGMTDEAWAEHWRRLTTEPGYRQDIENTLRTYLSEDELARATALLDQQAAAGSAEEARSLGRRPILEAISDADGTFSTTERHVVEAISHMSEEDQRRYRDDADFRRQLDAAVAEAMEEGPELDAARRLLDRVARGEEPTMDIVTRLQLRAAEQDESDALTEAGVVAGGVVLAPVTGGLSLAAAGAVVADEELNEGEGLDTVRTALVGSRAADTIRDLEEEFREHPEVRERILNPTTDEDRAFRDQFYTALRQTMSATDIERYAEPLIRDGHLSMETQMELNRGIADDSESASYDDLVTLARDTSETADAERARILTDEAYQDRVLGHLSADERQIALSILSDDSVAYLREHGEMRPVDALRAHMVGSGTGEEEIRSVLSGLSPEQQQQVRDDYARIYGRDLRADLVSELGGSDLTDAMRMTRGRVSADEDFAAALDDYMESRDGFGSALVDAAWDGTGYAADDALHRYAAAMTEFSARFEELPPERRRELEENLSTALEQFRESRGAIADAVVDSVIAIAAVGGAVFTDGVSLSLLACTGFGAAIFKVATRAAIMGGDYDFASMAGIDAATGFVDGFTSMMGPGEIGAMLRVGERAATAAATRVATEGGERLLRAGAEEALERSMTRAVRDAFVGGSDRISEETIERIAREVAREGLSEADEAALRASIRNSLRDSIAAESRSALERIGTEYGLNMAAGAMGGGSSGMIRGFAEWDPERSFEDNLAMVGRMTLTSAGFGAAGAGTFTAVFGAGSAMVRGIRDHFHLRPGEHLSPEQLAEAASRMGVPDGHLRQTPDGDLVLTGGAPERAPGDRDAIVPPPPERAPGDRDAIMPPPPERAPGDRDAIVPPPPEGAPVPAHSGSDFPRTRPGIDAHGDTIPPTRTGVDPHGDTIPPARTGVDAHGDTAPPPRPEGEPGACASSDEPRGMEVERLEGNRRRIHASDGTTHELIPVQSEWMYPARPPRGPVDRAVKLHVFSTGGEDLARLQDVLIPALENDPVLRELVPHWKTRDPLLAGEGSRAGADLEAFTIAVSDPADVPRVQQRIDEILAEHPELTLDRPIRPGGVDTIAGTSGRVGHLRDFFPATRDAEGAVGARVDDALSRRIHESAGVAEGARLSPDQLRQVESNAGLREGSLAYDTDGNLMLRTTDEASTLMEGQLYVGTRGAESHPAGERYMRDGVEVESEGLTDRYAYYRLGEMYGVDPAESVISGAAGHADTLPPPPRAEAPAGEAQPPSDEDIDVLAETMPPPPPREAAVGPGSRSGGDDPLADTMPPVSGEDRPTLRVPPPEVAPSVSPSGDAIEVGPHDFGVVDQSGDTVLLQRLSRPLPLEEPRTIDADELAREYARIGDTDYYYRTGDLTIYRVRRTESGDIEVRHDPNIMAMRRERFLQRSGGIPAEEFPRPRTSDSARGPEAE